MTYIPIPVSQLPVAQSVSTADTLVISQNGITKQATTGLLPGAVPSGVVAGSYGDASHVPAYTVDETGNITAAENVEITPAAISAVPTSRTIEAGAGLSGGGDLSANRTLSIAATGISAGSYGSASQVPTFTANVRGQLTAASGVSPSNLLVTPTGGTTARTLSAITADSTNPLAYGADPTGTEDSTAAFQAALNAGKPVRVPSGRYRLTSAITVSNIGVSLVADGQVTFAVEYSGTALTIAPSSLFQQVFLSGFIMESARSAGPCALAIDIAYPNGATSFPYGTVTISNVEVRTNPGTTGPTWANSWTSGIKLTNCWYPSIEGSSIMLRPDIGAASGTPAIELAGGTYACIAPKLINCTIYYGSSGVLCSGYTEGLELVATEMVGVTRGVYVPSSTPVGGAGGVYRAQAIWLTGGHIAAYTAGVDADTVQDVRCAGANIQRLAGSNAAAWSGVKLNNSFGLDITGGLIAGNTGSGTATGIALTGTTARGRISTTFENLDVQFNFGSSTSGIQVSGCVASGSHRDTYTNDSTGNYIIWLDNAGQYQFTPNALRVYSPSTITAVCGGARFGIEHSTTPTLDFYATSESSGYKRWRILTSGGALYVQKINDGYTAASTAIEVVGSGSTVSYLNFAPQVRVSGYAFADGVSLVLKSYTVATLPSAATPARIIYVSDGTSNKRLAVSDGTNWRWPDGTIVS